MIDILEEKIAKLQGYQYKKKIYEDLETRANIIKSMIDNKIFDYKAINMAINAFNKAGYEGLLTAVSRSMV